MNESDILSISRLQAAKTSEWHERDFSASHADLLGLVEENHHCNFELWHVEDQARRDDMGFEYVYRAKRSIDKWNQRRNDFIERIDEWLSQRLPPAAAGVPMNSETPGMIIDRLSILALKEFHMDEEATRETAEAAHREKCREKLAVIRRQREDLGLALRVLLDDCSHGRRGFRVYRQMKMYNDPALNPQLYAGGKAQTP